VLKCRLATSKEHSKQDPPLAEEQVLKRKSQCLLGSTDDSSDYGTNEVAVEMIVE
jgi:hypothetical protein